jgi:hypothetical protein
MSSSGYVDLFRVIPKKISQIWSRRSLVWHLPRTVAGFWRWYFLTPPPAIIDDRAVVEEVIVAASSNDSDVVSWRKLDAQVIEETCNERDQSIVRRMLTASDIYKKHL